MPQYTTTEAQIWISRANRTLYKLATKSIDEKFFENDNSFERERILIYVLKKAVVWSYSSSFLNQEAKDRVISLLISRISKYGFPRFTPIYNTGNTNFVGTTADFPPTTPLPQPPSNVGALPDDIILVGGTDITAGISTITDSRVLNKRIRLVRNNLNYYDWYKTGSTIFLTGIGDSVVTGEVFVIQFY